MKEKLSQFCHVPVRTLHFDLYKISYSLATNNSRNLMHSCLLQAANIVTLYDVSNIWCIPLLLRVCHICFLWSHFPLFWILESIFWAEFLCILQDQKAHEAILKVLNLDRVERFVSNI